MKPPDQTRVEWEAVPRVEKWTMFFQNPVMEMYEEFILCILQIFNNDTEKVAKNIKNL